MTPHQQLAEWRKWQGLSVREAGKMFRVSGQAVSVIENGGTPTVTTANIIERVTKGPKQVKVKAWGEPPDRDAVKP
jgi:predicted transcriptional regulator